MVVLWLFNGCLMAHIYNRTPSDQYCSIQGWYDHKKWVSAHAANPLAVGMSAEEVQGVPGLKAKDSKTRSACNL